MSLWNSRVLFLVGVGLVVVFFATASQAVSLIALQLGLIVWIIAILLRPREIKAKVLRALKTHGTDWGAGVGPEPGGRGATIDAANLPPAMTRQYFAKRTWELQAR
jgi:hypothetical protein